MGNISLMHLDLRTPLFYSKSSMTDAGVPSSIPENDEFLLCFALNPAQSRTIEPVREQLLGDLLFMGGKTGDSTADQSVTLPSGEYLFMQSRGISAMTRDEWLDLAIEQQKDGLWERYQPGDLLYIRFLFEDGAVVTQLFRTIKLKW